MVFNDFMYLSWKNFEKRNFAPFNSKFWSVLKLGLKLKLSIGLTVKVKKINLPIYSKFNFAVLSFFFVLSNIKKIPLSFLDSF